MIVRFIYPNTHNTRMDIILSLIEKALDIMYFAFQVLKLVTDELVILVKIIIQNDKSAPWFPSIDK